MTTDLTIKLKLNLTLVLKKVSVLYAILLYIYMKIFPRNIFLHKSGIRITILETTL